MPAKQVEKIHGAAAIFAFITRDAQKIGSYFKVTDRTVQRWAETPEWQNALDVFGYEDDRSFEIQPFRDTQRDAGEVFNNAREAYIQAIQEGVPKHRRATVTAEAVGLKPRRIRQWARRFKWEEETQ